MNRTNQTKKTQGKQQRKKAGLSWQPRNPRGSGAAAVIAVVGVLAALLLYFLQNSGVLALDTDTRAAENSAVRINEIVSQNESTLITESGQVPDLVEIINTGRGDVNIGGYGLMLKSDMRSMFSFPDAILRPGETMLVYCTGSHGGGRMDAAFKLEASGGDVLILLGDNGKAVDAVELPELSADEAYLRKEDGSWETGNPTPGSDNASNSVRQAKQSAETENPGAELSEICSANTLYFPDENGEIHDYVEIHNPTGADISLNGWHLSDSSDKLRRWTFPDVILPAGGSIAVHCSGYNRTDNPAHLHTDFKLSRDGEEVYLSRPDGKPVSTIQTPVLESGQACSLVNGRWTTDLAPTPGRANTHEDAAAVHASVFGDRAAQLRINEIMTSPTQQAYDWIEIYNGSSQAVDLGGYGLSDNPAKPRKWQFPGGTIIRPGEYLGVFLSGSRLSSIGGFLNADFALSSAGGYTVSLCDPDGKVLDAAYVGAQYGGVAYGRVDGQQGFYLLESGTPGEANNVNYYHSREQEAGASVQGGLFEKGDSFTVELRAEPGCRIYYTLDSSDPDETSIPYTGPITISDTTILRSRVYGNGSMPSLIDTQSYLYDVNNDNGSVYVVSLVSDPENLFSNSSGILVKGPNAWAEYPYGKTNQGANFWMDWEREAHVELFEPDGDLVISQGCGIKLHGQYSRATDVKAFKVIARKQYGSNRFDYPIFSRRDYDQYQSFLLRASGQDYNLSFMRDSILSRLAANTSVMYMESEVGVCYLNGQYYSLMNLRERVNKFSICQFEGWEGMEDEIDLIKANDIVMQGSNDSFAELLYWVKRNDMSTQAAYDYLDSKIDIQNYIEYMAIECFVSNTDTLNVKRYRNAQADGKWRWVLFDLDWALNVDSNSLSRWLTEGGMGSGGLTDNTLFIACMKNPTFARQFIEHLAQRMATDFSTESIMNMFMERYDVIENLLPDYQRQWGIKAEDMQNAMYKLIQFIETRPAKMLSYVQKAMKFSDAQMQQYFADAIAVISARQAG